ncbi:NERD domain-containing protein [Clostridioides difficile]
MLLVLVNLIWIIIKTLFYTLLFLIKALFKAFTFILKTPFLRFPFLLFTLGYLLHINFNILATIYFIYLTHLCALKFNIYKILYINLKYLSNRLRNNYKISHYLKSLKNDGIILSNIYLENGNDDSCLIDDLVITNGGIFSIKTLNYSYDEYDNDDVYKSNFISNSHLNNDNIIDSNLINKIANECYKCHNILCDILSSDIPITNIIALPEENSVIREDSCITTPIIVAKDLPYYIRNKVNKNVNYSPSLITESLLSNKMWIFDIFISKFHKFLHHSKVIILFFSVFLIIYYFYITFVSYIFFKLITSF